MEPAQDEEQTGPDLGSVLESFARQLGKPSVGSGMTVLVVINLIVLLCRPQNNIPGLGATKITIFLSLIPLLVVLPRLHELWKMSKVLKAMFLFAALGAVWIPLARNNFWAFHTWRDIMQQYLCYLFPILVLMTSGGYIRRLVNALAFIAFYLGLYSLTHNGHGPGGFLGDENDLCMQLLVVAAIPLMMIPAERSMIKKLWFSIVVAVALGGIVASSSRGGFLGLVAMLVYLYWKSPQKIPMTLIAVIIAGISLLFVPQRYWNEMSTIIDTSEGTTANHRMNTWTVVAKLWLHPPNFLFGTGMTNTPYHVGDFETLTAYTRSYAGRATHSTLMQLLGDLGTAGLLLFGTVVWGSVMGNNRHNKRLKRLLPVLNARIAELATQISERDEQYGEQGERVEDEDSREPSVDDLYRILGRAEYQCRYMRSLLSGLNSSWAGGLGAGLFISTLYYPPFWLLAVLSVAAQRHVAQIEQHLLTIDELVDRNESAQNDNAASAS